ncbi:hypothetical protein BD779DRAFT_1672368 [Infundibulicybe gibba]|nr:hypothetical protein BD779DRAFT_1672368 [Infundibulicybe gibba]
MQLFLSEPTPLNATYTNGMGQAIYKVATPDKSFGTPITTIRRIVPGGVRDSEGEITESEIATSFARAPPSSTSTRAAHVRTASEFTDASTPIGY